MKSELDCINNFFFNSLFLSHRAGSPMMLWSAMALGTLTYIAVIPAAMAIFPQVLEVQHCFFLNRFLSKPWFSYLLCFLLQLPTRDLEEEIQSNTEETTLYLNRGLWWKFYSMYYLLFVSFTLTTLHMEWR